MLECNQVAYIILGVEREIGFKRKGNSFYHVLPDGTHLDDLDRRKIYRMYIKNIGPEDAPSYKRKEIILLGKIIESCTQPKWDYGKYKNINLNKLEKR